MSYPNQQCSSVHSCCVWMKLVKALCSWSSCWFDVSPMECRLQLNKLTLVAEAVKIFCFARFCWSLCSTETSFLLYNCNIKYCCSFQRGSFCPQNAAKPCLCFKSLLKNVVCELCSREIIWPDSRRLKDVLYFIGRLKTIKW